MTFDESLPISHATDERSRPHARKPRLPGRHLIGTTVRKPAKPPGKR